MDLEALRRKKAEIVEKFGPWTAHNIHLAGGLYTIDERVVGDEIPLRRIVQVVSDLARKPIEALRVLDLACLEGLYGIELARRGAKTVGIEGREANIEKARFVKTALGLDGLELVQDDVRNLEKYGRFDVILCLGILYHLDVPDVIDFARKIHDACDGFAIFDTHVSIAEVERFPHGGHIYAGRRYREHADTASADDKKKALWASLDNPQSFWLTRSSLYNLLAHVGFTSVYECQNPSEVGKARDRITLIAVKGRREPLLCSPLLSKTPGEDWPEKLSDEVHHSQRAPARAGFLSRAFFGRRSADAPR